LTKAITVHVHLGEMVCYLLLSSFHVITVTDSDNMNLNRVAMNGS